jgi:hypothetical protein
MYNRAAVQSTWHTLKDGYVGYVAKFLQTKLTLPK